MKWRTNKHSSSNACLSNFISLYIFLSVYHPIYPSIYRTINLQQTTCLFNVLPLFLSPITSYRVFQKWFVFVQDVQFLPPLPHQGRKKYCTIVLYLTISGYQQIYRVFIKYCVFPKNVVIFPNYASSAAAPVFDQPLCTHTDTEGKPREARVRNTF